MGWDAKMWEKRRSNVQNIQFGSCLHLQSTLADDSFILNKKRQEKALSDMISTTWKVNRTPSVLHCEKLDRMTSSGYAGCEPCICIPS